MKRWAAALWLSALPVLAAGSAAQVFETAAPSVFSIGVVGTDGQRRTGSGVAVAPGKVATNFHVVKDAREIFLKHGDQLGKALLLSVDERHDLALLHADGFHPPVVRFAPAERAGIGLSVYAIGSPRGLDLSLSQGIISALRKTPDGALIQTTAPISPGSSGGGLFDDEGRLVGLTTAQIVDGQNLNFAIPVAWLRYVGVNPAPTEVVAAGTPDLSPEPAPVLAAPALEPAVTAPVESSRPEAPQPPPAQATPNNRGPFLGLALIGLLLLLTRPAIRWLSDWLSRERPRAETPGRATAPDRLLPFRAQAREEIKSGQRDADTWLTALERSAGDEARATVAYLELRAQALYRADLDRKWAAAQAQTAALPPRAGSRT
jgi:hypothetical protein